MSRNFIISITNFFNNLERLFLPNFGPPPSLAYLVHQQHSPRTNSSQKLSLKNLLGDGVLWAVPKHRRSVEKRLNRKFGYPEYVWKPLREKKNLRPCQQCGHDHELGVLCPHCYDKVRQETQLMQDKIQSQLGLEPIEQEVIVLYAGETAEQATDAISGKRIIEMKKPRPMWFTKICCKNPRSNHRKPKKLSPQIWHKLCRYYVMNKIPLSRIC